MTILDAGPDPGRVDPARAYVSVYPVDPMPPAIAALRGGGEPVWIFAYGSLMWNPDFDFAEARPAFLYGYHRSFCLYSRDYRGTPEQPGRLSVEEMARLLAVAVGGRGTGREYLANTVRHLEELGIHDALLHRIAARVAQLTE